MNAATNTHGHPSMNKQEMYWMNEGIRTSAFLLIIPGCTLMGTGAGMLVSQPIPYSVIGFGAGLLVWGLVVALRKRENPIP